VDDPEIVTHQTRSERLKGVDVSASRGHVVADFMLRES